MTAAQMKAFVSTAIAWLAFALAVVAALKLAGLVLPVQVRGSVSELALVAAALALARIP